MLGNEFRKWIDSITLLEGMSLAIRVISSKTLHNDFLRQKSNRDFFERLKYVSNTPDEFYIVTLLNKKNNRNISLQLSPTEKNVLWLMGVSTDVKYQNQGIASAMIEEMFPFNDRLLLTTEANIFGMCMTG